MDTGERLAAYLAGELDVDGTRALEAELARDPSLRARLEAIRATDEALAALRPVELPEGFSARLREAVAAELDEQLPADGDELAARRARKRGTAGTRSWWPQVAVAAAVLAVAGIGIAQLGGMSGGDEQAAEEADAGTMSTLESLEAAAGPTVIAAGRSFDADSIRDLADDARFAELTSQELAGDAAAATAESYGAELQAPGDDTGRMADAPQGDAAQDGSQETEAAMPESEAIGLRTVGDVTEEDLERVRACDDELLEAESAVIPVYVELVEFEGQDAIVYGFVGNDPEQDSYRRVELWVVGRGDCQVLHFTQVDR